MSNLLKGLIGISAAFLLIMVVQRVTIYQQQTVPGAKSSFPESVDTVEMFSADINKGAWYFEENHGQLKSGFEYVSRLPDYTLLLSGHGAQFFFEKYGRPRDNDDSVKMRFINPGSNTISRLGKELAGKSHYYFGRDASQWIRDVPHYTEVYYENLYPGIDIVYYFKNHLLEYDFVVKPGADPAKIQMIFEGVERIRKDRSGNLVLEMIDGTLLNHAPVAYQKPNGIDQQIIGSDYLISGKQVGFELEAYDSSKALIIDPGITYSSLLGGNGRDEGNDIVVDANGNIYVTGGTDSANFPGFVSGVVASNSQGLNGASCGSAIADCESDVFVSKFNAGGQLLFTAFLGADTDADIGDVGKGLALDSGGRIYVTGYTGKATTIQFPTTANAYKTSTQGNGGKDIFLSVLSNDGTQLIYSSIIGGSFDDIGEAVSVTNSGEAVIVGSTKSSSDFPIKNAAFQNSDGANAFTDGFVIKVSPSGLNDNDLTFSTYLAGTTFDEAYDVALDSTNNIFVTGYTEGFSFAGSASAVQGSDAFVVKLDNNGNWIFTTFIGGSISNIQDPNAQNQTLPPRDIGYGLAISNGSIFVTGATQSTDFPQVNNSLKGSSDAFVTMLDSVGTIVSSTYIGGTGSDESRGIAVGNAGSLYITGFTDSADFPSVGNNSNSTTATFGGNVDAFLNIQNATITDTLSSLFFGGSSTDKSRAIAIDGSGESAYITGWTGVGSGFPVTGDTAAQAVSPGGSSDAFVARFGPFADLSVVINHNNTDQNNPVLQGGQLVYNATVTNLGPDTATGVVLTVSLPPSTSVTYISNNSGCILNTGNTLVCQLANMLSGNNRSVQTTVSLDSTASVTATASVAGNEQDYPPNNSDSVVTSAGTATPDTNQSTNTNDVTDPLTQSSTTNSSNNVTSGSSGGGITGEIFLLMLIVFNLCYRFGLPNK
ncbi:MAG: SBBP repeat-containing protein [Gammaproteobacteria bacterium]